MNPVDDSGRIFRGLQMKGDAVCTAIHKILNIALRLFDHQMHVKKAVRGLANGGNQRHAKGDGRDEQSVHHINVDVLRSRLVDLDKLLSQFVKISG